MVGKISKSVVVEVGGRNIGIIGYTSTDTPVITVNETSKFIQILIDSDSPFYKMLFDR